MADNKKNKELNYSQFLDSLQKIQEQAIDGSDKSNALFSTVIHSLMPSELAYGKYKPLGQLIFKLDREFITLFSSRFKSTKSNCDKMAEYVKEILATLKKVILKLSSDEIIDNQSIIETLDQLNTRMNKMNKFKTNHFVYIGDNKEVIENLNKLDSLKKRLLKYLGTDTKSDELALLKSIKRELYEGGASLLGLIDNLSKNRSCDDANDHLKLFSDKSIQYQYQIVILSILQKGIRDHNFLLKGLGEDLENLINKGIISEKLWELYDINNNHLHTKNFQTDVCEKNENSIINDRYQISNIIEWSKKIISNTIGLPYLHGCRYVIDQYKQCIHYIHSETESINIKMEKRYAVYTDSSSLRDHIKLLELHSIQVFSSEYRQKMGQSLKGLDEVKKYQNSKSQLNELNFKTKNFYKTLEQAEQFDEQLKNKIKYNQYLIVINIELEKFITTLEKHLDTHLQKNIRQLLSDTDYSSLKVQLQNVFLCCINSIENYSFYSAAYNPIFHRELKFISNPEIQEMCLALDRLITLFKRPAGSLSVEQLFPEDLESYLNCESINEFKVKLRNFMEYLETQTLKSRQLTIIPVPGRGAGGYDKFTNTLVVPSFDTQNRENVYFALSDYIFTTMISSRADAPIENIYNVLNDKIKSASPRKQKDIVVIKVLKSIITELTAKNQPSGLSDKVVKSFMKYLDPPNDLIIFRDVINVPPTKRDAFLKNIMTKYEIKNIKKFLIELKTYLIEKFNHPELVREKTNTVLKIIIDEMEIYQKLELYDDIYDAGVILFDKAMVGECFNLFHSLLNIGSKESAILWNLATIIRFHRFNGLEKIVTSPQDFCSQCYLMFEKSTDLSEYWKMKARKMRLSMSK